MPDDVPTGAEFYDNLVLNLFGAFWKIVEEL